MARSDPPKRRFGLLAEDLQPTEVVLHHWPAPQGRGLLTSHRCLLLSHPQPLHRSIDWSTNLEGVRSLQVTKLPGRRVYWAGARGAYAGGAASTGRMGPLFCVVVNEITVYAGEPRVCEEIQQKIDDARASRCMALVGHIIPYGRLQDRSAAGGALGGPIPR